MAAFFASIQAHFTAALSYIASMGCVQMLLSAIAYLTSMLIVTFGLGASIAVFVAWALFLIGAAVIAWGTWKVCKWVKPYAVSAYNWTKDKVVNLFSRKKAVAVEVEIEVTAATAAAAA